MICGTKAFTGVRGGRAVECVKRLDHRGPHQQEWASPVWDDGGTVLLGRVVHTATWMETRTGSSLKGDGA